ncbi:MAG: 30S ribosomal protein S16 [Candidatus Peregrinibacteria bacterium]|nr:30S ribosomal protein S16 [Candidatus Peregrinibacteria bacterium]
MLIIRFARRGRKKQAFFDLVVTEKSRAAQKKPVEKLGYLNPHTDGGKGELVFDADKTKKYIVNGAQMSQSAARLLVKNGIKEAGKFIEERQTKPKKEAPKPEVEEAPAEEAVADETPVEEEKEEASEVKEETEKTEETPAEEESKKEDSADKAE